MAQETHQSLGEKNKHSTAFEEIELIISLEELYKRGW